MSALNIAHGLFLLLGLLLGAWPDSPSLGLIIPSIIPRNTLLPHKPQGPGRIPLSSLKVCRPHTHIRFLSFLHAELRDPIGFEPSLAHRQPGNAPCSPCTRFASTSSRCRTTTRSTSTRQPAASTESADRTHGATGIPRCRRFTNLSTWHARLKGRIWRRYYKKHRRMQANGPLRRPLRLGRNDPLGCVPIEAVSSRGASHREEGSR